MYSQEARTIHHALVQACKRPELDRVGVHARDTWSSEKSTRTRRPYSAAIMFWVFPLVNGYHQVNFLTFWFCRFRPYKLHNYHWSECTFSQHEYFEYDRVHLDLCLLVTVTLFGMSHLVCACMLYSPDSL